MKWTESSFAMPAWQHTSLGVEELSWQFQNNGQKGSKMWKEVFMCDDVINPLPGYDKWRVRTLVRETVNWNVCRIAIALYYL
jgi:hypothetical protein